MPHSGRSNPSTTISLWFRWNETLELLPWMPGGLQISTIFWIHQWTSNLFKYFQIIKANKVYRDIKTCDNDKEYEIIQKHWIIREISLWFCKVIIWIECEVTHSRNSNNFEPGYLLYSMKNSSRYLSWILCWSFRENIFWIIIFVWWNDE